MSEAFGTYEFDEDTGVLRVVPAIESDTEVTATLTGQTLHLLPYTPQVR